MDNGEGRFIRGRSMQDLLELKNEYPKAGGFFTVGEELEIKGSLFRVKQITPFGIKLKLLKRDITVTREKK